MCAVLPWGSLHELKPENCSKPETGQNKRIQKITDVVLGSPTFFLIPEILGILIIFSFCYVFYALNNFPWSMSYH